MGKEYLVEGARLLCVNGSRHGILTIPAGHGYTSAGRKKANCTDCKACINIPCFGTCKKNEADGQCEGYMLLAEKWESTAPAGASAEKIDGENALTMDSVLLCRKGGLILPLTSGQGYEKRIDWGAFMKRFQKLMGWAAGKNLMCHVFGGDPVNLNTGNFIYEKEDLKTAGSPGLSFRLFYNSMEKDKKGCLGEGWHHNHEMQIRSEKNTNTLHVCLGDGREIPYRPAIGDLYTPLYGDRGLLKKDGERLSYHTADGSVYTFSLEGRLLAKTDRNKNTLTYGWNQQGQLIRVTAANGGELRYAYSRAGKLTRIKDQAGREVALWYRYGKLFQYINPAGHTYTYDYNENGKLESVTTPRNIVAVKNTYDAADRVVRQEMPDGGVTEFLYDDENSRTYQKDQNGKMVIYESDGRLRNVRTIYGDGEETYEYNERNQITLFKDKNGNKTRYSYDGRGNLAGVTDALGGERSFAYDKADRLLSASIEGREVLTHAYNGAGQLIKTTDALGRSREITYHPNGRPSQIILPDKSSYTLTYEEKGNIQSITNPSGNRITYQYDALNRVTAATDAEGNRTCFQYDERDHLLAITNPEGNTRSYTCDESGRPARVEDYDGGVMTLTYNTMGKPETLTDKENRTIKRSYDQMGNLTEETTPSGAVLACTYDRNSRMVRMEKRTSPEEETPRTVYTYAYDPAGNLLCSTAGDTSETLAQTTYEYDALNRLTAVTGSAGGRTAYTYDPLTGKINSVTDPAGNRRTLRYNDAGELTEETDPRGNTTRYEYSALGQITRITDGAGRTTIYTYHPGGRRKTTRFPDGRQLHYAYDSLGRIHTKEDGQGYRLQYQYDAMGRILRATSSEGQEQSYTYDAMGNTTSVTDAMGNQTLYAYTLGGKLKETTDALGNRTTYAYDQTDRLTGILQQGKDGEADCITTYERNAFGQMECFRDGLGGEEKYQYDALDRIIQKTDKEGNHTRYAYTPDGKTQSIEYGDGKKAEYVYDCLRQLTRIHDWLGETAIDRNRQGAPVRVTDPAGSTVSYQWGTHGERTGMVYPDGTSVSYRYDPQLRLTGLERLRKEKPALCISYRYDEAGRLAEKSTSGGQTTRWHYDHIGRPLELHHEDNWGILDSFRYAYDAMGNKTGITRQRRGFPGESGSYRFQYDPLHRLTAVEKDGQPLRSYQYDTFGNRTAMQDYGKGIHNTYAYDTINRLLKEEQWETDISTEKSYTYDRRGNLVCEYQNGELLHGYAFNAMNRMEKAWDNTGKEAEYQYNGLGQRTGRKTGETQEDYLLDLTRPYHNLLAVKSGEERVSFYWDSCVAAMEEKGRPPRYYLQDELGSPLRALYGTGNGDAYGYDEFGRDMHGPENEETGRYSRQGEKQPFGYTGYRYDEISGTYFAQAREYRTELGRFTAEDVRRGNGAVPQTMNRYTYCWNQPLHFVDGNGRDGYYFYDPDMFPTLDTEAIVDMDVEYLQEKYDTDIHVVAMDTENNPDYTSFQDSWNDMDKSVDVVVIMTHANNNHFVTDSIINEAGDRETSATMTREDIIGLEQKSIYDMYLLGCNMGLTDTMGEKNSLASTFYSAETNNSIGMIFASDGTIFHGIDQYGKRILYVEPSKQYHPDDVFDGFKIYCMEDGLRIDKLEDEFLDMGFISSTGYDNTECENEGKKDEKYGKEKKK